jgi:hypothetical protein
MYLSVTGALKCLQASSSPKLRLSIVACHDETLTFQKPVQVRSRRELRLFEPVQAPPNALLLPLNQQKYCKEKPKPDEIMCGEMFPLSNASEYLFFNHGITVTLCRIFRTPPP